MEATDKLQKILLKRYVEQLVNMSYADYHMKDPDMPDCSICLVKFENSDEIVVYDCDQKHYFHKQCGIEWLQTKPECPLCRKDFTEDIKKYKAKADKATIANVAREAVMQGKQRSRHTRDSNVALNQDDSHVEEQALQEMVRELEATISDLNR